MQMHELNSSAIKKVGYDESTQKMRVQFPNGTVQEFDGVPPEKFVSLTGAHSHGGYFNSRIRNQYPATIIKPDDKPVDKPDLA